MTGTQALEFRGMRDGDLPNLLRLWEDAGWGALPADLWAARHRSGPHGASRVTVAVDDAGVVVGQLIAKRTLLNVHGSDVPAARIHGAIISPDVRRRHGYMAVSEHPLLGMILSLVELLIRDGVEVAYVLPNERMLPLLRHLPETVRADSPFWSRPLHQTPTLPTGHEIVPVGQPSDIDALWARCRDELVCTARDARTLAWKALFAPLRIDGIQRRGELVAVVASRSDGDGQWLMEDLLAVDDDARAAAIASVVRAAREESAHRDLHKIGALAAPALQPALAEAGFLMDDYTYTLLVQRLSSAGPAAVVEPARWYLSPND